MGSTCGLAKLIGLVAPLANGVDDARLREALHRVHGVAPESVRPAERLPGGLTRGMMVEARRFCRTPNPGSVDHRVVLNRIWLSGAARPKTGRVQFCLGSPIQRCSM